MDDLIIFRGEQPSAELRQLTAILAEWTDGIPLVGTLHLFGSRVRGDHRPDSDVDARVEFDLSNPLVSTAEWLHAERTDFAEINERLPGKLHLHPGLDDWVVLNIVEHGTEVHRCRKVRCLWAERPK